VYNKHIAREWLIYISSFIFGLFILPFAVQHLLNIRFTKSIDIYITLVTFSDIHLLIYWSIVMSPYFTLQLIRITFWALDEVTREYNKNKQHDCDS